MYLFSFAALTRRRNALLPFALLLEPIAPVPFGVHIIENGCCYLGIELSRFR
jgi:hypothetical protein